MIYLGPFIPLWIIPLLVGLLVVYRTLVIKRHQENSREPSRILSYYVGIYALCMICSGLWLYLVFDHWSGAEIARERVVSALWQSLIPLGIGLLVQGVIWLATRASRSHTP